jgi:DNA-binding FadR family transcriptional regulator
MVRTGIGFANHLNTRSLRLSELSQLTPAGLVTRGASSRASSAILDYREAAERIRAMIDGGRLRGPGRLGSGRLPSERELAEEFGVSRRVLRQALGLLEAEGRISRQHGRGTFATDARHATQSLVHEMSRLNNPVDTLEARLAIEPMQARLAALRATQGDIDRLFEAADASRDAKDPLSYEKADAAFHRRIAAAARNPLLIAIFDAVLETALDGKWRHGRETAHCINNQASYAADHRKIANAIAERNAAQAETAMRAHLTGVQKRLIEHAFPGAAAE